MTTTNKLLDIQNKLKAPKNQRNSFGNYNYRSAEDILEAVKPLLKEQGCTLILSDEMVQVGERIYVKATATFSDGEKDTVVTAFARESETKKGMDDSQITGTASSYARKYALNGLFLIDDTKDADTDEYQNQTKDEETKPKTSGGLDFEELKLKYSKMTTEELRKEYVQVKTYKGWSDKQKEAVCNIIKKIQESK